MEIYRTLNSRMQRERGVPGAAARFGPRHRVSGGAGRSTSHKLRRPPVHCGGAGGLHPPRQLCGRVDLRLLRLGHSIRRRRCSRKVPRGACTVDHTRWVRAARRRVRQGCRASAAGRAEEARTCACERAERRAGDPLHARPVQLLLEEGLQLGSVANTVGPRCHSHLQVMTPPEHRGHPRLGLGLTLPTPLALPLRLRSLGIVLRCALRLRRRSWMVKGGEIGGFGGGSLEHPKQWRDAQWLGLALGAPSWPEPPGAP